MDRHRLKVLLENYRTPFEEEEAFVKDFVVLTDEPLAYSRLRTTGHFTGSAWVVNKNRTHTLLTLHRKLNKWLQLGGHADDNENLLDVAMTEAREESGLHTLQFVDKSIFDIDRHVIPARGDEPRHFHYDVRFLLEAEIDEPLTVSSESKDLAWVSYEVVEELVMGNTSIMRMLEKTSKSEVFL